jgi:hypothetical protein
MPAGASDETTAQRRRASSAATANGSAATCRDTALAGGVIMAARLSLYRFVDEQRLWPDIGHDLTIYAVALALVAAPSGSARAARGERGSPPG